jgi:proline iminopeptidase
MHFSFRYPEHLSQLILLNSAPADYKGQKAFFSVYFYDSKDADKLTLTMSAESAKGGTQVRAILPWRSPEFDILSELEHLKVPTLIIHGSADVIPEWTAQDLNNAIPGSQLHIIENCGHFPYIEKPDELFSIIRNNEIKD